MLWLRCIKEEKTSSKTEGMKKENESYMKCGGTDWDFCQNDYKGLIIDFLDWIFII